MELSYVKVLATIINFALFFAIIITIYKAMQAFKKFMNINKEMNKKLDIILNKLEKEKSN